jgi:4'-phosphopantetheinyl transferase
MEGGYYFCQPDMPLILKINPLPDTVVSVWKITEDEGYFISRLQLSEAENQLLQSIKHISKRLQWLSSRLMIRQHLDTKEFIELKYSEKGHPSLVNFGHNISISHTANVSAVIVSKDNRVGVDIEQQFRPVEDVAHKFVSEDESAQRKGNVTPEEKLFIWSVKESLYKFHAEGKVDFKKNLWVKIPSSLSSGITDAAIDIDNVKTNVKAHYQKIDGDYFLCWIAE